MSIEIKNRISTLCRLVDCCLSSITWRIKTRKRFISFSFSTTIRFLHNHCKPHYWTSRTKNHDIDRRQEVYVYNFTRTFSSLQYPQAMYAVDDAAVFEQVLVAKATQDVPVDAWPQHLISVLTKLGAELFQPVVKVSRVASLVVGDLLQLHQVA